MALVLCTLAPDWLGFWGVWQGFVVALAPFKLVVVSSSETGIQARRSLYLITQGYTCVFGEALPCLDTEKSERAQWLGMRSLGFGVPRPVAGCWLEPQQLWLEVSAGTFWATDLMVQSSTGSDGLVLKCWACLRAWTFLKCRLGEGQAHAIWAECASVNLTLTLCKLILSRNLFSVINVTWLKIL